MCHNAVQLFVLYGDSRTREYSFKIYVSCTNLSVGSRNFSVYIILSWNSWEDDTVLVDSLYKFECLLHRDLRHILFDYLTRLIMLLNNFENFDQIYKFN